MTDIGYLGPIGTYSHLVAEKRFGKRGKLIPLPTIMDVCRFASGRKTRMGVVPIENSSGGAIHETVDILLAHRPRIHILEELSLDVRLALLGHSGDKTRVLYSHFAPLEHCASWIGRCLPGVQKRAVATTALAAQFAASEKGGAALGSRRLAGLYGLRILKYPVEADVPNITAFLVVAGRKRVWPRSGPIKTTIAAKLPNEPGSLCTFLETFRNEGVNLSRIVSRPIRGCPREYAFLVDVEGHTNEAPVKRALASARKTCVEIRVAGSFPSRPSFSS